MFVFVIPVAIVYSKKLMFCQDGRKNPADGCGVKWAECLTGFADEVNDLAGLVALVAEPTVFVGVDAVV